VEKEQAGETMKTLKDKRPKSSLLAFFQSESAVSSAVEAILLLAIVFSIFSVIQIGYIPEWKADGEHSHMTDLWEDMTKLKSRIDRVSLILMSDSNSSLPQVITTIPLRNSIGETPVLGSSRSSGAMSVNVDTCRMIITASGSSRAINCGTIAYNSNNNYYTDQVFAYENGALILDQREKAVMKKYPMFRVYKTSSGGYNFLINAIEIAGSQNTVSANSDCSIRLKQGSFSTFCNASYVNPFVLELDTNYPDAWEIYLNDTMSNAGLKRDVDYTLSTNGNDYLSLTFPKTGSTNTLKNLYICKSKIEAELVIT
jgi:hypothetical protein